MDGIDSGQTSAILAEEADAVMRDGDKSSSVYVFNFPPQEMKEHLASPQNQPDRNSTKVSQQWWVV